MNTVTLQISIDVGKTWSNVVTVLSWRFEYISKPPIIKTIAADALINAIILN